jgi:predicted transcriptional regulator
MQYRDKSQIIREILDIANGAVDITTTRIMHEAFLDYAQAKEYLALLTEFDLINYGSITHTYKTADKGLRLLQFYNQLGDMTKKVPPTHAQRRQQALLLLLLLIPPRHYQLTYRGMHILYNVIAQYDFILVI